MPGDSCWLFWKSKHAASNCPACMAFIPSLKSTFACFTSAALGAAKQGVASMARIDMAMAIEGNVRARIGYPSGSVKSPGFVGKGSGGGLVVVDGSADG